MSTALQSVGGVYVNNKVDHGEADNFEALKKAVLAEEARKKEDERERRRSLGLPAEDEKRKEGVLTSLWKKIGRKGDGKKVDDFVR